LAQAGGTVSNTIFVRIASTATATNFSTAITHASDGATSWNVTVSGSVTAPSAPTITSTNFSGTVGVAFSNTATASGTTPITFSGTNLPGGLNIASSGVISGTPTNAGTNTSTLTASNSVGTTNQSVTFTIAKGSSTLVLSGTTNFTYNGSAQGPTNFTQAGSTNTPSLSYAGTNGTSYGAVASRPTNAGSYAFSGTVTADGNYNSVTSAPLVFVIGKATPVLTAVSATSLQTGQALSNSVISGATFNGTNLPGTYAFSSPGTVPTNTATHAFTFTPTDTANYNTATTTVSVTVNPASGGFDTDAWLNGETMNPVTLGKLAIGGATSATANDGEKPVVSVAGGQLVLSAIVRTNGPAGLEVIGEAVSSLADYGTPASITPVDGERAAVQGTVPEGCERQEFKVNQDGGRKFLRLKATLP